MRNEFDVLIVGAGPVGLWLACELALARVNVAVLERRAQPVTQSRALAIQGRTLEVFALRGLADRFLSRGRPIPKGHFGGLATALDFSVFDTRFPFTLLLPQATTEALLAERALELGVQIRRGHVVENAEPRADGILLEGRNGGTSFRFAARYAIGADGARSNLRRVAGIEFVGHPAQHAFMLAEVVLDAPPERPVVTIHRARSCSTWHLSRYACARAAIDASPADAARRQPIVTASNLVERAVALVRRPQSLSFQ